MKTTYNKPQVEIIDVETTHCLMNGSPVRGDSIADPGTSTGNDGFNWDGWGK